MPWGRRHDGAFVRRLYHGGALLLSWRHSWRKGREGAWGGEGRRKLDDLPVSRQTRGRCLAVLVGNPSHSHHPEGFYPGARPPDIEEVHCVWQWCICPSQAAPLAQGGALDGWRAGWARPDEGRQRVYASPHFAVQRSSMDLPRLVFHALIVFCGCTPLDHGSAEAEEDSERWLFPVALPGKH